MLNRILMLFLAFAISITGLAGAEGDSGSNSDSTTKKATTLDSTRVKVLVERKLEIKEEILGGTVVWLMDGIATPTHSLFFFDPEGELIFAVPAEHFPAIGVTLSDGQAGDTVKVALQGQVMVRKPVDQILRSGSVIVPGDDGVGALAMRSWCEGAIVGVVIEAQGEGEELVLVELRLSSALEAFQAIENFSTCGDSLGQGRRWQDLVGRLPELSVGGVFPWLGWASDPDSFQREYEHAVVAQRLLVEERSPTLEED